RIKPAALASSRVGVMGNLGGFGGLFDLKACGYTDPLLVAATDGVGTKLKIAIEAARYDTLGIDLVAMCVNDLVVQGAEPLFFLDYFATGQLDVEVAGRIVDGIAEGCRQAGCALIGGETAEMPGLYAKGDFDLAGFAVGAVERAALLPRADLAPGQCLIGLPASGFHANGFSLIRKIVAEKSLSPEQECPFSPGQSLADALLAPTALYVKPVLALHRAGLLKAAAHITGGGLTDNVPRFLPEGLAAHIELSSWSLPAAFAWIAQGAGLDPHALLRTFNCGIGMVLTVSETAQQDALTVLRDVGESPVLMGWIEARTDTPVHYHGDFGTGA
ncbi:MAG: phosphoribosylformylglycinamidine cyclo-ligase, partial [Pseudomonadota bacterium]